MCGKEQSDWQTLEKRLNWRRRERIPQHMKKIQLLINLYPIEAGERFEEISLCLQKNIANPLISEITVLDEGFPKPELFSDAKVTVHSISRRPDFADFYDDLNPDGINLISNNDIWFDQSLKKVNWLGLNPYDLICLTRREPDKTLYKSDKGDAQDSWLFLGKPEPLKNCTFPMGVPGCENRLAFLFFLKRYRVLNPSKIIRAWHEHRSGNRNYQSADRIEGPYLMSRPVGLVAFHLWRLILKIIQGSRVLLIKDLPDTK